MKKFKKVKSLLFGFILTFAFCFINTNVYAKTMTSDEIQGPAYVIGSHVFTREVNETTGYEGRLTTNLIMLASQTIESSDLDSMIIYYKTASGMWINGLTGATIEAPESFEINYTNLQLEDENNTVSTPKTPILDLNGGPLSINEETDMLTYQLDIYIDDIDDKSNKTDGVELAIVDNDSHVTQQDLEYGEKFETTITVLNSYTGYVLEIGKQYHRDFISFENPHDGYYTVSARAYVEDGNGKRSYSDWVYVSINVDKTLPQLEIINNYSNPKYVDIDGDYYTYRLGIKIPDAYVYKVKPEKFAYITNCADGTFAIDEEFSVAVAKDTVKSCYAQMGYIDKNGDFNYYYTGNEEENRIYYTIDTRTLTAPTLYYNVARDYVGPGSTPESIADGEYIYINDEFYKEQEEDTLDYQIEGAEIYRVYYKAGTTADPGYKPVYELIADNSGSALVFPPTGSGFYTARVYATNEAGERVYSDFSDRIGVVRTPLISASEVVDGKVTITIENIDEYWKNSGITFTLYTTVDPTNEEVELASIIYQGDQEAVFEIEVTENMEIYADASIHDWVHSTDEKDVYAYSYASNGIDIVVE